MIVIGGPTGSGKTALAIRIAGQTGSSIISADSRQVFKELKIGSAAPSDKELQTIPHYFIGTHHIWEDFSAGVFAEKALQLLENKLFSENQVQVVCGGSGLYLDALVNGMDEMPVIPNEIRQEVNEQLHRLGISFIQEKVKLADPEYFAQVDRNNPRRLIRALEVIYATGRPFSDFRKKKSIERPFQVFFYATELPREDLYNRINMRTIKMVENGWFKEAQDLTGYRHLNALQTVGYREIFEYFDGRRGLDETIDLISQNTRRYAKRQITWLRNQADVKWIHPESDLSTQELFQYI